MSQRILKTSPSSITSIQLCLRKAYFSKVLRLSLKDKSKYRNQSALDRGDLIHKMLAEYYLLRKDGNLSPDSISNLIQQARAECLIDKDLESDIIEAAIKAFAGYVLYHKDETWEIIGIEEPFSKILYESEDLKIIVEGKIDLIIKDREGKIYPVDHKSVSQESYPNNLTNQFIAYPWALETTTLIENRIGLQKTKPPEDKYTRHIHSYTSDQIEEWKEDVVYHIRRMDMSMQANYFPGSYAHCWNCVYKDLCNTSRDLRDKVIDRDWENDFQTDLFEAG